MDPRQPSDPAEFKRTTLKSGAPVGDKLNSLVIGTYGPQLISDVAYVEEMAHFNRERIPERVVHAKGAAAYGEFVVTNSSEISKYCKAALFAKTGKKTPVVARFSHVTGESGIPDTQRDVRGFSVKFYTELGNWDLVGNNLPVFFIKDPINFASFIHSQKRNPKTHLRDPDAFWDFVTHLPESIHTMLMLFSERGIPDGFRHMHGYGVNTFKLINSKNEAFYAKFHWICNQQIKNLEEDKAARLAGKDADYSLRDLQDNINKENYPVWTFKFQVMSLEEAEKADFNIFDATKTWPQGKYPLHEIGKMTLNKNPDNYFAQVEQLAFSPANMVQGIESSPDKMLMGRMLSYPDAQRYRLGANYADIPSNQPKCPVMTPTYCDGVTFNSNMSGAIPNYVPSIKFKNLNIHDSAFIEHSQHIAGLVGRYSLAGDDNFTQPKALYQKVLNSESRKVLAKNLAAHIKMVVNKEIVKKLLIILGQVDKNLEKDVASLLHN